MGSLFLTVLLLLFINSFNEVVLRPCSRQQESTQATSCRAYIPCSAKKFTWSPRPSAFTDGHALKWVYESISPRTTCLLGKIQFLPKKDKELQPGPLFYETHMNKLLWWKQTLHWQVLFTFGQSYWSSLLDHQNWRWERNTMETFPWQGKEQHLGLGKRQGRA